VQASEAADQLRSFGGHAFGIWCTMFAHLVLWIFGSAGPDTDRFQRHDGFHRARQIGDRAGASVRIGDVAGCQVVGLNRHDRFVGQIP
jgi:hypothetical protein